MGGIVPRGRGGGKGLSNDDFRLTIAIVPGGLGDDRTGRGAGGAASRPCLVWVPRYNLAGRESERGRPLSYTLTIMPQAQADVRSLPRKQQRQVVERVRRLRDDPRPQGAEPMKGRRAKQEGLWKWRSGDYRIIYSIRDRELIVIVVRVGDRKDVYKWFR